MACFADGLNGVKPFVQYLAFHRLGCAVYHGVLTRLMTMNLSCFVLRISASCGWLGGLRAEEPSRGWKREAVKDARGGMDGRKLVCRLYGERLENPHNNLEPKLFDHLARDENYSRLISSTLYYEQSHGPQEESAPAGVDVLC